MLASSYDKLLINLFYRKLSMKAKDILPLFALTFLMSIAFNYFWGSKDESVITHKEQTDQRCKVPTGQEVECYRPLHIEVGFKEEKNTQNPTLTTINTAQARYVFSTEGASLQELEFKREGGGTESYLETIFPPSGIDNQKRAFLVALEQQTPLTYTLVNNVELDDRFIITYESESSTNTIRKEFTVFKDTYRLDLELTFKNKEQKLSTLRFFFPAPLVSELGQKDTLETVVLDSNHKMRAEQKGPELLQSYWIRPTLFGLQDRYFVHSLVSDPAQLIQRAYYKAVDVDSLWAILESKEVHEGTWKLSFYCGPKESTAITKVEPRLEQVLNYGWLAFISRPASKIFLEILNFLHRYTHSYGWAIIILVILMRLIMMPFTGSTEQAAARSAELKKKLAYIDQRYKNDKEEQLKAKAEAMKKYGGFGNALVLLLQVPFFIALGWVLSNSIQLYKAPFLWIPDLSSADPYYILPFLIGGGMVLQGLMAKEINQKISFLVVALIIGCFAVKLSSGLALYIVISTFAAMGQTLLFRWWRS